MWKGVDEDESVGAGMSDVKRLTMKPELVYRLIYGWNWSLLIDL